MAVENKQKERVLVILGPTATGKSHCAIEIAKRFNGEIISGDSMLVYQDMNIGTAKPTAAELAAVPHHLVNICHRKPALVLLISRSRPKD